MDGVKIRPKSKLTPEMEALKWKPGQTGNSKGRPKKERYLPAIFEQVGDKPIPQKFLDALPENSRAQLEGELAEVFKTARIPIARAFAYMEWRRALSGDKEARANICNLLSGKFHRLMGLEIGEEDRAGDTRAFLRMIYEEEILGDDGREG